MTPRPRLLLVTDPLYPAAGRRYGDEDVALAGRLRERFVVASCPMEDAVALMDAFDLVLVRNSGPVLGHPEAYAAFRAHAEATGARVLNDLGGRGDMRGKQYLVDLTREGAPVIPTVDRHEDLPLLPRAAELVVKPVLGADSLGMRVVRPDQVPEDLTGLLVQPRVDFLHEVSFVFVGREPAYALYAPDPAQRWRLRPWDASDEDLAFARRFVAWNGIRHGVQRVDACRLRDGSLLLVELEDLNPYLSLEVLPEAVRERFVGLLLRELEDLLAQPRGAGGPG